MTNMSNKKIVSSTKCYFSHSNFTFKFVRTVYKDVLCTLSISLFIILAIK